MYLADYHTHSATSPDGQLTVSELAEAAVRAGLYPKGRAKTRSSEAPSPAPWCWGIREKT